MPHAPSDPLRAERILAFLASEGLVFRRCVLRPKPASLKSLARVHTADYLDQAHEPDLLAQVFGGPVNPEQIDRLLDLQRLHVGGTKLAVRAALARRAIAIHLGGGLHHAHHDQGAGFCVFNDIAVAVAEARHHGFDGRVLVIDLDLHDGDGTRAHFADDPTVHTFSIHARDWDPAATHAQADTSIALGEQIEDAPYLAALRTHLPAVIAAFRPDLVFYLAGTDPAHDDQLGNWNLSVDGMLTRDRFVVQSVRDPTPGAPPPLVVLLAGGYGPQAWRYSARFLGALLSGHPIEPPSTETITLKRYRWLASLQDPLELSGGDSDNPFGLTEDDLFLPGWGTRRESRLLGYYTRHGLELTLERAGLLDRLRDLGFAHPTIDLQLEDPNSHTLRIHGEPERRKLLCELRVGTDRRSVPELQLLAVGWLLLQNPSHGFSAHRSRLPGQQHPGLGMANDVVGLLLAACDRLHLDGLLWVPSHFHTAAPWSGLLIAVDPIHDARIRALVGCLVGVPLDEANRALAAGEIVDADTGQAVAWEPQPMVLPHSPAAKAWAHERKEQRISGPSLVRRRLAPVL